MRSARECLARAIEMERQASLCDAPIVRADLLSMAETWRYVAQQALWQDIQGADASRS
jgi:hypothetical protein